MTGDPAVGAAAVALLAGWGDPIGFLAMEGDDATIATAVVTRAQHLQVERIQELAKLIGIHVGNQVARILARAFR